MRLCIVNLARSKFITLGVHLICLQHVRRDAARRAGLSATADPCISLIEPRRDAPTFIVREYAFYEFFRNLRNSRILTNFKTANEFSFLF